MKHLQRIFSLCFALIILVSCMTINVAHADGGTTVNFRLVLSRYMNYASCQVFIEQYENMTSKDCIGTRQLSIGRTDLWQGEIELEPGFYQVTYVSVLGSWDARDSGSTERFEVKGDKMTVYVAVDTDDKPAELPPQWLVYGEDDQKFHLWDDTPDLIPGNDPTEPGDTTEPTDPSTPPSGEDLPTDPDTGTQEGQGPNHGERPDVPTLPNEGEQQDPPVKKSVQIGNIVFYSVIALIFIVCFILLRKIQKDRGA